MEMMESNISIRSGLKNGILSHLFSCKLFTLDTELGFFDHLIYECVSVKEGITWHVMMSG